MMFLITFVIYAFASNSIGRLYRVHLHLYIRPDEVAVATRVDMPGMSSAYLFIQNRISSEQVSRQRIAVHA